MHERFLIFHCGSGGRRQCRIGFSLELLMESARTGLRQIMSDLLRRQPAEEAVLLAWPLVCGKEVAARSQAIIFSNGKLDVEVPDATWRSQLQSFASRYLSEYEHLLGPVVRGIEFKLQRSALSDQRAAKKLSAASDPRAAHKQLSALSPPRSAKPVRSVASDTSDSTSEPRVPSIKTRKRR
jgi:Dna[CI] antecedent DciA-like protein